MIAKSLQEVVYGQIFPGGLIPIKCKDNIPAIDARIKEIAELAQGKVVEGMNRRLGKMDSLALTEQIIQLRDSCEPPMSYREIMRRLGNVISPDAARNRYDDVKKAKEEAALQKEGYAALSGEAIQEGRYTTPPEVQERIAATAEDGKSKEIDTDILLTAPPALPDGLPANCEEATTRNSRMVQEIQKDKRDLTSKQAGHINGPKIPHSEDESILAQRDGGKKFREIMETLQAKGIECRIDDVTARYQSEKKKREKAQNVEKRTSEPQNVAPSQPQAIPDPSPPGAEGAQDEARANPRGTPEAEEKPAPSKPDAKLDYYEVVDSKIIAMKKRQMLNHEIAQALERNPGGSWTTQKVDARYTELKRQGLA